MTTKPYVTPGAVSVWWVVLAPSKLSATGPIHQHDAVGRVRLLVFDNCEHVVDSVADLVEAILAASATVTILATSREGVGARLADEFPDGVWFFDLAAVADPAAVPDAVAAVLGIIQHQRRTVMACPVAGRELRSRIRGREPFRRPCPKCGVGLLAGPARRGGRGGGNLPPTRRHSVGHRVGGLADGVDDGQRGA
jgi:predicted ATPase